MNMGCLITRKVPHGKRYWENDERKNVFLAFKIYRSALFTVMQNSRVLLAIQSVDIKLC